MRRGPLFQSNISSRHAELSLHSFPDEKYIEQPATKKIEDTPNLRKIACNPVLDIIAPILILAPRYIFQQETERRRVRKVTHTAQHDLVSWRDIKAGRSGEVSR